LRVVVLNGPKKKTRRKSVKMDLVHPLSGVFTLAENIPLKGARKRNPGDERELVQKERIDQTQENTQNSRTRTSTHGGQKKATTRGGRVLEGHHRGGDESVERKSPGVFCVGKVRVFQPEGWRKRGGGL